MAVRDAFKAAGVAEDKIDLQKPTDITAGSTSAAEGLRVEVCLQLLATDLVKKPPSGGFLPEQRT